MDSSLDRVSQHRHAPIDVSNTNAIHEPETRAHDPCDLKSAQLFDLLDAQGNWNVVCGNEEECSHNTL